MFTAWFNPKCVIYIRPLKKNNVLCTGEIMHVDTCVDLLGCPLGILSMDETVNLIVSRIKSKVFTQHVVVNVSKIVNMK